MTTLPVGLIGLGIMGSAISGCILRQGIDVLGFDVDPDKRAAHQARGGRVAANAADVAAECSNVISSLPHPMALAHTVSELVTRGDELHPDFRLLETSTLAISDKAKARDQLASVNRGMVDAPVSGTGQQATTGDLVIYLSGDADDKAVTVDTLSLFSRAVYDVGSFGNGMRLKFVANHLVAIHNAAAAEALLLARSAGLDLDLTLRAITDGAGTSRMLEVRGPLMAAENFDQPTMTITNFMKDLGLIGDFSSATKSATPLFDVTRDLYQIAAQEGRGDQDTAAVFEVIRGLTPDH
jgi:3-hydroxyisobutyrate dehydrogenase-like beta-hydroxyacid dehydrogenase